MDLSHRYSLLTTAPYDQCLAWIICTYLNQQSSESLYTNQPIDKYDSALLIHLFVQEVHPNTNLSGGLAFNKMMPRTIQFGLSKITADTFFLGGICAAAVSARLILYLIAWPAEISNTVAVVEIGSHLYYYIW